MYPAWKTSATIRIISHISSQLGSVPCQRQILSLIWALNAIVFAALHKIIISISICGLSEETDLSAGDWFLRHSHLHTTYSLCSHQHIAISIYFKYPTICYSAVAALWERQVTCEKIMRERKPPSFHTCGFWVFLRIWMISAKACRSSLPAMIIWRCQTIFSPPT